MSEEHNSTEDGASEEALGSPALDGQGAGASDSATAEIIDSAEKPEETEAARVAAEKKAESEQRRKALIAWLLTPLTEIGALTQMAFETVFWAVRPPYRFRVFISAMEFIGVGSVFIVALTGLFMGAVLGLQLADGFSQFNAQTQTGAVVGIAMTREIGPVFTALMVSSRAGSAITTELGSMRVSDQINALVTMAVNPIQYLVVPRVLAGMIMVPILNLLFNVVGIFGAYFVCTRLLGIDPGIFLGRMRWLVDWPDLLQGLIKAVVFGFTVTLVACRHGFYASGGAAGVGQATNRSVVQNAIVVLALDYFITALVLGQGI